MNSDIKFLTKVAEAQGWTVGLSKGGHMRFTRPDGRIVGTSQTPSDHRSWLNFMTKLRHAGLDIPRPEHKKKSARPDHPQREQRY